MVLYFIGFTRCFLFRSLRRIDCKEGGQCLALYGSFVKSAECTPWILSKIYLHKITKRKCLVSNKNMGLCLNMLTLESRCNRCWDEVSFT